MPPMFQLKQQDLKQLEEAFRKSPKRFRSVTGRVLNTFAFESRLRAIKIVESEMMSRRKGFANKVLKVERANFFRPIDAQRSQVGSIRLPRFSGWVAQQNGRKTNRTRVATSLGRGGKDSRQIAPSNRLRKGKDFKSPDEYKGRSQTHRAVVMLQHLNSIGYKKPFIITGHKRMAPGLYKFRGRGKKRGPQMLQSFNPIQVQPKVNRWLTKSVDRMFKMVNIRSVYSSALKKAFKVGLK